MQRALCPVLVGRQDELALLDDVLRDALAGHGQLALLAGDPGSGKSRLSLELATVAESLGATVLVGACPETDLALPYLPFVETIGAHLAGVDKGWVQALGNARHELAKLFPQIPTGGTPDLDDPVRAKLRLFEAIGAVLDAIAGDAGLILILEDMHNADTSSRELLEYLTGRLPRSRLMILATYRSEDVDRHHPLHSLIEAWRRNGRAEVITLKPLSPELVAEMVKAIFDATEVPSRLRDALHQRSEGNPFVLEEVLKEALDEGTIAFDGRQWTSRDLDQVALPRTVADGILRRLDRLDPGDGAVLRAASVLGPSFGYAILMDVADVSEADLQRALEVGMQQQLLEDDEHSSGPSYRFRHALTRDAIYQEMVEPQRQRLHARAAAALRRQPGAAPVDIAVHLLAAGEDAEAVPMCLEAAQDAIRRRGYREAADIYKRVLPHIRDAAEQGAVLCQLGEAMWRSGDPATAQEHLEKGTATLDALGRGTEAAHHLMTLARCHWERSHLDLAHDDYERARGLLVTLGPSEDLAVAYCGLAGLYAFELDGPKAQHFAELAIAVAGEVGADAPLTRAYNFLGIALVFQGQINEGIEFMDQSHRQALEKDLDWNALTALYNSIIIRLWHLRAAECPALVEKLHDFPAGWWRDLAYWRARALTYHMLGELETALAACDEVQQLAEQGGASTFSLWAHRQRAYLLAELGRAEEGLEALPPPQEGEDRQELFFDYQARMRVHLYLNHPKAAAELAALVLAADDWAQDALIIAAAVEAYVAAGQSKQAQHLLARAVTNGLDPTSPYLLTSAARINLANGDPDSAIPRLSEAARVFQEREYRIDEIRARLLAVTALAAKGKQVAAQAELDRALALADQCGATAIRRSGRSQGRKLGLHLGGAAHVQEQPMPADEGGRGGAGLAGELRLALRQDQLLLHYQPQLNLVTGRVDAAEALVRWQHPRLGLIYPDRFIPIAEKAGLIGGITQWVLAASLEQARDWLERGLQIKVSVNMSASDISDPRFAEIVETALERAVVEPQFLCLEVTESQIMDRPDRALATLNALKAIGVALSIDDFGTGHSSLAYVRELPMTELKIDRSFCMDLDDRNMVIVRAAIEMGHNLGMTVTAEGVEKRTILEAVAALGCDHVQGLVIGPGILAPALTRRVRREAKKIRTRTQSPRRLFINSGFGQGKPNLNRNHGAQQGL